ncbi:hypothetical protein OCU04_001046 [Sclerotinia nivalis]|uniref:Heterokaryon incompatibility domain-containing protein n=1 Tax=Sclerotinia nivalis TaxID=352851 RepID=A0A9X0AXU0_9HELO|nr:hypothetical protein OCU04_001046 [Sclerotinia nivalis]
METHLECRDRFNPSYVPSRLIDVGIRDLSGNFTVPRLIETKEYSGNPEHTKSKWQYITLSHCWGKSEHLETRKENLDEMKIAIPLESMNKTYADAVRVARGFQIQYLWIDSLCIVQNSKNDWNEEASRMCFVYNNTAFNIAAVAATDGDDGFLSERLAVKLGHVIRLDGKKVVRTLWIRPCLRDSCVHRKDIKLSRFPLFGRAWVLQESILAARTLAFCPVSMHFRCRVKQRSDQEPFNDVDHLSVFNGFEHFTFHNLPTKSAICSEYVMDVWYRLLSTYSTKEMSSRRDKLPAIGGLAFQVGSFTGDRYLAGLWEHNFPQALCWTTFKISREYYVLPASNTALYIAPSWSWASLSVPFGYSPVAFTGTELLIPDLTSNYYPGKDGVDHTHKKSAKFRWEAQLLDTNIDFISDCYGQVKAGYITLMG